jgi:PAS domain S-box-containing protein
VADTPPRGVASDRARRILVVEDDDDFAESLAGVLEAKGLQVCLVRTAAGVAPALEGFDPQVALVDVRLGRASGLDVVAALKTRKAPVLTVVMTAYVATETAIEALRRGAYDYLIKPFEPGELFATLDRCFERIDLAAAHQEAEAARHRSDARLRALFDNSLDLVAVVDPQHAQLKFVSPSVGRLLGYVAESVAERDLSHFVHPEDRERILLALQRWISAEPGGPTPVELRVKHLDGSWRWFELVGRSLLNDPVIAGVLVHGRDITERRAMEEQLRQAQRLEAVGQLTGGVAHDFNNLLAVIMGNLEILRRELRGASDHAQLVEGALHAAERGATLIRRLLAFSRRQTLSPRPIDLNALVRDTLDLVRRALGARVQLETAFDADLWPCTVDAAQVETALLNLAINARDAMPAGGKVRISTRNVLLAGDLETPADGTSKGKGPGEPFVCIAVTDTGVGIPPEIRDRVFEPFFSTKAPGQGTGLGLSMVFGFVKQSNGQVRLVSEMGKGTTFSLYFPRSEAAATVRPRPATVTPLAKDESILLVEDDAEVRIMLERLLSELGYRVTAATDGRSALALLEKGLVPDLLVTDVVLPEGPSGFELADLARTRVPALKLLFTSGYSQHLAGRRPAAVASAPLLAKPFHRTELAQHIRRALDA